MNIAFLSHIASRLVGERVTVYPDSAHGGEARMSERGTWEIVLHPDVIAGRHAYTLRDAFLHEVGHIVCGHVPRVHYTEHDRAAARVKYAADMTAIMRVVDAKEQAADRWGAAVAPVVDAWCMREHGRTFDELARE